MATKKDLIEAQGFSRRRLLTAFTSGAPGGKELEPAKPLRAVIVGMGLAVMVIVGGVFYGMVKPGLPDGWQNNKVILVKDTGARYLAIDGILYPVINATSARLLLPADGYKVITASSASISTIPIGPAIGILGAPDDVPQASALVANGWTACPTAEGTALSVPGDATAAPDLAAALVRSDGRMFVVTAGTAHLVDAASTDAVLRAVGLAGVKPLDVDSRWLNLFRSGTPLAPLVVSGAGEAIEGSTFTVGTAVHPQNSTNYFIVTADGELAPLTPLALQLYALGTGSGGTVLPVTPAEIIQFPTASEAAGGIDWPTDVLAPVGLGASVCAVLGHDALGMATTTLATTMAPPTGDGVTVAVGSGALVAAGGEGGQAARDIYVVDQTGAAFAVPGANTDVLARLGYTGENVMVLTTAWMQFFKPGPELTVAAAGATPVATSGQAGFGTAVVAPTRGATPPGPSASATPSPEQSDVTLATQEATSADASSNGTCERGSFDYSTEPPQTHELLQADDVARVATGEGVVVAVVDSGIDVRNAHLKHAVVGGVNLVNDGEPVDGMTDLAGHGTAIAGVIAGELLPEKSTMVGLAPGAKLLSVRVFRGTDEESVKAGFGPDDSREAKGIRWAVDNGATVINVSMSGVDDAPELRDAVNFATAHGVLIVASAGNRNTSDDKSDTPRYPAANPGVLAVSAVNLEGNVTDASIHGAHVDVAAPGQAVLTSMAGGGDCVFASESESTSYATAYVSAAAALVAQAHPSETPAQWGYRLMATAIRSHPDAREDLAGWGLIQPLDAITLVPGSSERGPASPFTSTEPVTIAVATTQVKPHHTVSAFLATEHVAVGAGIAALVAMGTLGILTRYRRKQGVELAAPDAPIRTGLLDAARSDRTRLQ